MPAFSLTRLFMVWRATPSTLAASVTVKPSGSRKSWRTMRPGCGWFFMGIFVPSLVRLVLSPRRIETEDPSLDNHHLCAGDHFARLFSGRLNGVARTTKYPGVFTQVNDSVHKLFQTGIELCCLAAQPTKVMCLGKWHIGPDKKGLESLLDRLLAMENGIFGRRWLCRQVDSSVAQVVRRFT